MDEGNADILFSTEDLGFSDAFIQRIRISPDQRYMAVSLKSQNSEEATCVIVKLGHFPAVEKVIRSVFSFGKFNNKYLVDHTSFFFCVFSLGFFPLTKIYKPTQCL